MGTSTSKEAKEYFSDLNRHCIRFERLDARDDLAIQLAFSRKLIEERKDWLSKFRLSNKSKEPTSTSTTPTPTMTRQQPASVDGEHDDGDGELIEHVNLQNSVTINLIYLPNSIGKYD